MAADFIAHFVFVDFENVPEVELGLAEGRSVQVTLLIGKNQKKLDLSLVQQIHRLAAQVKLVEVGASGRNALDLTLACYLGRTIQQWPLAQFHIVSKDQDFDPMIGHLAAQGIKVARCDAFHLLSFLPRAKAVPPAKAAVAGKAVSPPKKTAEDRSAKVFSRLKNPATRNRPSTENALIAHIKTALGKESSPVKIDDVIRKLREKNALSIEADGKVSWQ